MSAQPRHPTVSWSQKKSYVFITFDVDEAVIQDLSVADGNKLHFKAKNNTDQYEATLELYENVKADDIKRAESNTRVVELCIGKKDDKWWPRLLKEKSKVHWLRVDFNKWVDEDDEGAEGGVPEGMNDFDFSKYMSQMGNMGGMGGMGAGSPNVGELDDLEDESDSEMPELEEADEPKN